jgi:beta-lactam-binding protein with PASTA domain
VRKLLAYFLTGLLLLVVALVSALVAMRFAIHVGEVKVPDFRGRTSAEARRIADQNGVNLQFATNYYSATVAEGRVLSQGPAPGTLVRRGWDVQLALSLGPQRVVIPQVVGESGRAAAISIAERGLQLSSTDEVQLPDATAGQVIAQDPTANATDVSEPKISLLVARDLSPPAFVMPDFVGQPLGSVTNALHDAGFSVGKVTAEPAEPAPSAPVATPAQNQTPPPNPISTSQPVSPASMIVSQDPPAGHEVLAGAAINFVVK